MTTVGYGDISASGNPKEQSFCIFMIFFGLAMFSLVQSRVGNMKESESTEQLVETKSLEM